MRFIKQHLSLLIPLIALLFSLESIVLINRSIIIKEGKLLQNYSIIIASKGKLTLDKVKKEVREAKYLEPISVDAILGRLKNNLDAVTIRELKKELPYFYALKLSEFPSLEQIGGIKARLDAMGSVIKVETFSKSHSQNYKLLLLIKKIVITFATLIFVLSFLLIIKQIELWRFEHSRRMEIMNYLGAPAFIRNGILFRLSIVDSFIAVIIISVALIYLSMSEFMANILDTLDIEGDIFNIGGDFVMLLSSALIISILAVLIVIFKPKKIWSK